MKPQTYIMAIVWLAVAVTLVTPFVNAQSSLGVFKQNDQVQLVQTCSICSYITLDSIKYPDGTISAIETNMTKVGSTFYYNFTQTSQLGEYIYNTYYGNWTAPVSFEISVNGKEPAEGIVVVIFSLIFIAIIAFGIIYFLKSLAHVIQLEMDIIDAGIMVSTYLAMWLFYYFSFEYLGNALINDLLEMAISIGAVTHMFLPLVGFLVSFIMTNLKAKKKARITY
jgi:hypothetical protein